MSLLSDLSAKIDARRRSEEELRDAPDRIVVCDKEWNYVSDVESWIEYDVAVEVNDTEEGWFSIPGDHPLADWLVHGTGLEEDLHFYIETAAGMRLGYKVDEVTREYDAVEGYETVSVRGLHDFEHTKHILFQPNTIAPLELQVPKSDLQAGRSKGVVRSYFFRNLARMQQPGWLFGFNLWGASNWQSNMIPDQWQVIMAPQIGPDTSEWTILSARMDYGWDFVRRTLDDAGLQITAKRWLPGDPQPFPTHTTLSKPTLVLDVVERSFLSGSTGTILDPILDLIRVIAPDGTSETITIADPNSGPQPPEGIHAPVVIWRASQHQGLAGSRMVVHKANRHTVVIGGKSPQWVNSSIKLLLNSALGWIGTLIGLPGLGLGLFDKAVEDVVLAWQRFTSWTRKSSMGSHAYKEDFAPGDAWTISGLQAGRVGLFEGRGYVSFSASVVDYSPYVVGRDVNLGDRCGFEIGGRIWLSHIVKLRRRASREVPAEWLITVGDSRDDELAGTKALRHLETLRNEVSRYSSSI
ncbi:Gp37-like protein [Rhodococcus triatomae]|nr:hypothetical protein G419_25342 [Rhodococcus triatomae BKS 15-14]